MTSTDPFLHPLDRLSVALAASTSRREALRRGCTLLAGAFLASLGLEAAAGGQSPAECRDFCNNYFPLGGSTRQERRRARREHESCLGTCRRCRRSRRPTCLKTTADDIYADCCDRACCGDLCCEAEQTCCVNADGTVAECVDTRTDRRHCGRCDEPCPRFGGDPQEYRCCGGECRHVESDPYNCGECGHRCTGYENCEGGECRPGSSPCAPGGRECFSETGLLVKCCGPNQRCCLPDGNALPITSDCCDPGQYCDRSTGTCRPCGACGPTQFCDFNTGECRPCNPGEHSCGFYCCPGEKTCCEGPARTLGASCCDPQRGEMCCFGHCLHPNIEGGQLCCWEPPPLDHLLQGHDGVTWTCPPRLPVCCGFWSSSGAVGPRCCPEGFRCDRATRSCVR
jgi:hypothetical protein